MDEDKDFLRQDNNYRTLKAFQKAECIYDVTYYFANTFLKVGDRSIDQRINGPGVNGQKSNQPTQPIKPTVTGGQSLVTTQKYNNSLPFVFF